MQTQHTPCCPLPKLACCCPLLQKLYAAVVKLFSQLPLAALVEGSTLILHGGLFRAPPEKKRGQAKYKNLVEMPQHVRDGLQTGSLKDLKAASKGGMDPDPDGRL